MKQRARSATHMYVLDQRFTEIEWAFLWRVYASGDTSLVTPQDISTAKWLSRRPRVTIRFTPGEPNSASSRRQDGSLPRWRRYPTASLSEFGFLCLEAAPDGPVWTSELDAALRPSREKIEAAIAATAIANMTRFSGILSSGIPITLSLLDASDRTMAVVFMETLRDGRAANPFPLAKKAILAWNRAIVASVPRNLNPLFRELRAELRPIERPCEFVGQMDVVASLRTRIPTGTTARDHLDLAAAFLQEVEELYHPSRESSGPRSPE